MAGGEIIEKWKELSKETDDKGWTALHYAAEGKWASTVKKLLEFDKSAAYVQDLEGKTALHVAALNGHEEIMKEIILECPDCCDLVDKRGRNVLHFAVESNRYEAVRVITNEYSLSHLLNATDYKGTTPFHLNDSANVTNIDVRILRDFLDLCRVDHKLALNCAKNQNALHNVVSINKILSASTQGKRITKQLKMQKKAKRIARRKLDDEEENDDREIIESVAGVEKARESTLVTATLIATVTFAAAFTMPGGYVGSDDAQKAGTPVLAKSAAFQAFMVTDSIALAFSSYAVFYHILVVLNRKKSKKIIYYNLAVYLTTFAMAAMLIAFITGIYAVLEIPKLGLAIFICVLVSIFTIPYLDLSIAFSSKTKDPTATLDFRGKEKKFKGFEILLFGTNRKRGMEKNKKKNLGNIL